TRRSSPGTRPSRSARSSSAPSATARSTCSWSARWRTSPSTCPRPPSRSRCRAPSAHARRRPSASVACCAPRATGAPRTSTPSSPVTPWTPSSPPTGSGSWPSRATPTASSTPRSSAPWTPARPCEGRGIIRCGAPETRLPSYGPALSQEVLSEQSHTGGMSTPEATLLVVEDETNIRELLTTSLKFAGFEVHPAADGNTALRLAADYDIDLAVMDVMLPDMDGFTVTRRLRDSGKELPVLFLTARDSLDDKVKGLTVGGDDYVTKPFSLEELVARIRAVLRRTQPTEPDHEETTLRVADLELDEDRHEVIRAGKVIDVSPTEFKLL